MPLDRVHVLATFDQLWADAVRRHNLRLPPVKGDISSCTTLEDVIKILERDENVMKAFRERGQKIRDFMRPFVSLVKLFVDAGAETAASKSVPGGKAVFNAFGVLLAATKGVSQTYDALEELLSKLQGFLERLDTYLTDPSVISTGLKEILVKILEQLLEVLALCAKRFNKKINVVRKFVPKRAEDYVKVLVGNTDVQDALNKLDKLTKEEQQKSIADILVATKVAAADIKVMHAEQQEVTRGFAAMQKRLFASGSTQWLSPPDPVNTHLRICKARRIETGDWFFGPQFAAWKETTRGVFWIHGKPGCGKSVLFSAIVDRLQSEQPLAYFYLDSKQTVRGLVSSLIYQLSAQSEKCSWSLRDFHETHRTSLSPPSDGKLVDLLVSMLRDFSRIYILLDALDELSEDNGRRELLVFLKRLVDLKHDGLRLLFTSRLQVDLHKCMSSIATEQLSLHDAHDQASSLARHIADRFADFDEYPDWPDDLRSKACDVLISKADGMFVWADLQLESLRDCLPIHVTKALAALPASLYDMYARILEQIKPINTPHALRAFQCIAFAARSLTPHELAEVFTLDLDADEVVLRPEFRPSDPEAQLLRTCSSLIQVVTASSGGNDKKIVQFVHFTAQEYLLSPRLPEPLAAYGLNPMTAHVTLATVCLQVLNSPSSFSSQPFSEYAVRNWMLHIRPSEIQEAMKQPLSTFLRPNSSFFSRWLNNWVARPDYLFTFSHPYDERSTPLYVAVHLGLRALILNLLNTPGVVINVPRAPLVYAAVTTGNIEVTRLVLERGANVNEQASDKSAALHVAAYNGNHDLTLLLLNHGAAVDVRLSDEWAPLHLAVQNGHVEVTRLLLDQGTDVDICQRFSYTPLHMAAHIGHVEISRELLEHGANVDARERHRCTPLHIAAKYGHVDAARELLERGATIDARQKSEFTPLHVAAESGHLKLVHELLERGASVDARARSKSTSLHLAGLSGVHIQRMVYASASASCSSPSTIDKWTPLHLAAQEGHIDVLRLLLQHGAAVDAPSNEGFTPLHLAAFEGRIDIAQELFERGASVDVRASCGSAPLHLAAQNGHVNVVGLLIEQGAVVDDYEEYRRAPTSLHLAAEFGHADIVRLLLDHGATVDACDENEQSPLYLALRNGHGRVMRLLFERGAVIDPGDVDKLLFIASGLGHVDVARLLLERGANVNGRESEERAPLYLNPKPQKGGRPRYPHPMFTIMGPRHKIKRTPLHIAALRGHVDISRLLLDYAAAIDIHDEEGQTPLQCAAQSRRVEVAHLLFERGAAADAQEMDNFLFVAAENGNLDFVRLLLARGAHVNTYQSKERTRDKNKCTPLHLAASRGHVNIVRLLLSCAAAMDDYDGKGQTPLHYAAINGKVDVVRVLVEHCAAVDVCGEDGQTPLHLASKSGHVEVSRELLDHDAAVDARDSIERTPLHLAAGEYRENFDIARLLLERGATVHVRDREGQTPLHLAARKRHVNFARELLDHGAAVDARDNMKRTPLHLATVAFSISADVARLLLNRGAAIAFHGEYGQTPLHLAAQNGRVDIVRLLLEHDVVVDARDDNICTPLHLAARSGHDAVARLLLEHGAVVDTRQQNERTPLHLAAREGHVKVVRCLLNYGAAIDARTEFGWTVLHTAAASSSSTADDVVGLLVKHGADIEWRNHAGQTALLCALDSSATYRAMCALLNHGASFTACDYLGFSALDHAVVAGNAIAVHVLLQRGANNRSDNAPHGSCIQIADRASRADVVHSSTKTWRLERASQHVSRQLREAQPEVTRGDVALCRLRRYRSVGSWGAVWTGIEASGHANADAHVLDPGTVRMQMMQMFRRQFLE